MPTGHGKKEMLHNRVAARALYVCPRCDVRIRFNYKTHDLECKCKEGPSEVRIDTYAARDTRDDDG